MTLLSAEPGCANLAARVATLPVVPVAAPRSTGTPARADGRGSEPGQLRGSLIQKEQTYREMLINFFDRALDGGEEELGFEPGLNSQEQALVYKLTNDIEELQFQSEGTGENTRIRITLK